MTNADILLTILSETTGRPRATFRPALDAMRRQSGHRLDERLTDAEAERLLAQLRREKAGIWRWIAQGAA